MDHDSHPFTAELTVEGYLHGVRIDSFLVRHFRNYTPFRMQRLVRAGQVRIEGAMAGTADRVYRGQMIEVRLIEPPDHLLASEPLPLEILYEDPWIIVVNKPADLVVHPCGGYSGGSLANALQAHFDTQTQLRGLVRPGIVHRLDRLTSGVIACTKDHLSHRRLSIHFQQGQVSKAYLALVHGEVADNRGEVALPIGQTPGGLTIRMSVAPDSIDPRAARTRYEVVERFDNYTLVQAFPFTGRLHQIRVHLAGIGHPVVADEFYSPHADFQWDQVTATSGRDAPAARNQNAVDAAPAVVATAPTASTELAPALLTRQALHAHRLSFAHPILRDVVTFEAPLPPDMTAAVAALREHRPLIALPRSVADADEEFE